MVWIRRPRLDWISNSNGGSRIPLNLQTVFVSSNRGTDVKKAPPGNVANKTFNTPCPKPAMNEVSDIDSVTSMADSVTSVDSVLMSSPPSEICIVEPTKPVSPQNHLDQLLSARGFSTTKRRTLQTGYYAKPSPLQQASHDVYLGDLARGRKHAKLKGILEAGISPNPCNSHGESIIHMISRRCDYTTLEVFLNAGASVQVSDDYGRTPLHDACWRPQPCFEIIELIASNDMTLFYLEDARGFTPLAYVSPDHWSEWIKFLDSIIDTWWNSDKSNSDLINAEPCSCQLADPENALDLQMTRMVAAGKLTPAEVKMLIDSDESDEDESDDDEEYDSDEDLSDYDDDSEFDSDDDYDMSDEEMEEIMGVAASGQAMQ